MLEPQRNDGRPALCTCHRSPTQIRLASHADRDLAPYPRPPARTTVEIVKGPSIVVPLDGSAFAERALRPACSLAARTEEAQVLLMSCTPDDPDAIAQYLDDRAALYVDVVDVETRVLEDESPVDGILATLVEEPDAILCMATHGRSSILASVLGSVARHVVCRSRHPLVLVGPHCRTTLLPGEHGRLLACSDGSPFSSLILPAAGTWCARLGLEPWLVEVVAPDESVEPRHGHHANREEEAALARLAAAVRTLRRSCIDAAHEGAPRQAQPFDHLVRRGPPGRNDRRGEPRPHWTDRRAVMGSVATDIVPPRPLPRPHRAAVGGGAGPCSTRPDTSVRSRPSLPPLRPWPGGGSGRSAAGGRRLRRAQPVAGTRRKVQSR